MSHITKLVSEFQEKDTLAVVTVGTVELGNNICVDPRKELVSIKMVPLLNMLYYQNQISGQFQIIPVLK